MLLKKYALGNSASKKRLAHRKPTMRKHMMGRGRFRYEEFNEFNLEEQSQSSQIPLILHKCQHLFFALVFNYW